MNNSHDVQFLDSEEDLKKIAEADGDAIIDYLQLRLPQEVVTDITIDKENINLLQGEKTKVTANVGPDTAKNKEVKWTSSDEKIAKVDNNGNIEAVGIGTTKITVESVDNSSIKKIITVNIEKEKVKFEEETLTIPVGKSETLNVTISPSWIENKDVVWETSDKDIIEVSNKGEITAKKEGTATIKVTWKDKNLSDEIKITAIQLSNDTKIEIRKYKEQNKKISNIGQKIKIEEFLSNIVVSDNLQVDIQTANKDQEYIGTNTKVTIKEKEHGCIIEEYQCLIYGDINGDGKISAMDYTLIKNHIMDVKKITHQNMTLTADVNGDNKISAMDYTLIKNDIMDVKKIQIK